MSQKRERDSLHILSISSLYVANATLHNLNNIGKLRANKERVTISIYKNTYMKEVEVTILRTSVPF